MMAITSSMYIDLILVVFLAFVLSVVAECGGYSSSDARCLDRVLQNQAYKAFVRPRTGVAYEGEVPPDLTGIGISAMRLRAGSLRNRGVKMYREFTIPTGVLVNPYVERLVLVYQNLGERSEMYYPPPPGYVHVTSVLGLLAYDALNLSATDLPLLDIVASDKPIVIQFGMIKYSSARCVFYSSSSVNFSRPVWGNGCYAFGQGHFSMVVMKAMEAPSPSPSCSTSGDEGEEENSTVWIVAGSVVGWVLVLFLLGWLVVWGMKYKQRKKMERMEKAAGSGEALRMMTIGRTKAPVAIATRTRPILETDYAP